MSLFYIESKKLLYITNWYENKVTIVDTTTNLIKKVLKVGRSPAGIFISEKNKKFLLQTEMTIMFLFSISIL